ncbi:unnamed protein product [Prorocentrum cordatum]|uniref:Uncharacterized protein n=1 Tax=Prorocentrum cordatum TaxID=2364126 RepID=A0ABN9PH83_9DINO|nr:unnamed protein product [Polarella glacialis]
MVRQEGQVGPQPFAILDAFCGWREGGISCVQRRSRWSFIVGIEGEQSAARKVPFLISSGGSRFRVRLHSAVLLRSAPHRACSEMCSFISLTSTLSSPFNGIPAG